jgi:hypothetical protein
VRVDDRHWTSSAFLFNIAVNSLRAERFPQAFIRLLLRRSAPVGGAFFLFKENVALAVNKGYAAAIEKQEQPRTGNQNGAENCHRAG